MGPAIDQVVASLDLDRAWPPPPAEMLDEIEKVDVVVAEVTRPSPTISFELGVAAALRIPIACIAAEGARVSPAFGRVAEYSRDASVANLAFFMGKEVERALVSSDSTRQGGTHGSEETATPRMDAREPARPIPHIEVGERYNGVVVHVDASAGFLLIASPDRPTAMLHARNMRQDTLTAFEVERIVPGNTLMVEVFEVDSLRQQVQLRDIAAVAFDPSRGTKLELTARLHRAWSMLEHRVDAAEKGTPELASVFSRNDLTVVERWATRYRPKFAIIRGVRNRLAHGENVSDEELTTVVDYAEEALTAVDRLPGKQPVTDDRPP